MQWIHVAQDREHSNDRLGSIKRDNFFWLAEVLLSSYALW